MQATPVGDAMIRPDVWYHVACVIDRTAGSMQLFVDGRSITTTAIRKGASVSTKALCIGWGAEQGMAKDAHFNGVMDEIGIWDRPLTAQEVADLFAGADPLAASAGPRVVRSRLADRVVLTSDKVPAPVSVRYAWANNPAVNLCNKADLPAAPFAAGEAEDKLGR